MSLTDLPPSTYAERFVALTQTYLQLPLTLQAALRSAAADLCQRDGVAKEATGFPDVFRLGEGVMPSTECDR